MKLKGFAVLVAAALGLQFGAATRHSRVLGFEQFEGDHTNRVAARFLGQVLPFFSKQLK